MQKSRDLKEIYAQLCEGRLQPASCDFHNRTSAFELESTMFDTFVTCKVGVRALTTQSRTRFFISGVRAGVTRQFAL